MRDCDQLSSPPPASAAVPTAIVGIGAAAGGGEALQSFFTSIPADCGIAFILLTHTAIGRDFQSLVSESSRLPVVGIGNRMPVEANRVYMAPEQAIVTIKKGVLCVSRAGSAGTSIDLFLQSLAEDQGAEAIGVILSGRGSDGVLGLKAIAEAGGMTMAQDSASATCEGMPRAAATDVDVDHVLPPQRLAAELIHYIRHLHGTGDDQRHQDRQRQMEQMLPSICDFLLKVSGHDFRHYKPKTLIRRIKRRMQILQIDDARGYVERLRTDTGEVERLFKALLIGVTGFFRDPEAFAALAREVIPKLFAGRDAGDAVRIWVPGCASGEEAYSIAILVREHMDRLEASPEVQVFATDIDERALAVARRGTYPLGVAETLPAQRLRRFFVRKGEHYQVTKAIRELCLFSRQNLISDPPLGRLDLISCRNVLIYLGTHLQQKVIPMFHQALRPGGYLFLGLAEDLVSHQALFQPVSAKHRISRSKPTDVTAAAGQREEVLPARANLPPATSGEPGEDDLEQLSQRILLDEFAPRYAVVNDDQHIVYVSEGMGKYLEMGAGAFSSNIVRLARTGLRAGLRAALNEARAKLSTAVRDCLSVPTEGGIQPLRLTVQPMPQLGQDSELFMVVFEDAGPVLNPDRAKVKKAPKQAGFMIEQLERELATTRTDLERTVQELEASNEELKGSNEELRALNEEYQAANEELEASKDEIQLGVQALARAKSDLENLLKSTEIATIFLDADSNVQLFTPAAANIYNFIASDIGRPLGHLTHRVKTMPALPPQDALMAAAAPIEEEVESLDGRYYLRRVSPYRAADDSSEGMVLTFTDVTELRESDRAARRHLAEIAALYHTAPVALCFVDTELRFVRINERLARITGFPAEQHLGNTIHDMVPNLADQIEPLVRQVMETGSPVEELEVRGETDAKPGVERVWLSSFHPLVNDSGRVLGASIAAQEITERKQFEQSLREAQEVADAANRSKSQFLANMSHEIRTPMTAILGYADVLAAHLGDADSLEWVDTIKRNGRYLLDIVNDILDLSKIEANKLAIRLQRCSPVELVADVRSLMGIRAQEKRLPLEVEYENPIPETINTDPVRLRQILINLLSNAIKFTDEGYVKLSVRCMVEGDEPALRFAVSDTGIGITKEQEEHLFKPFTQADTSHARSYGGTGLGLALSQRLARMLSGEITLYSEANQGTTAVLTMAIGSLDGVALIDPPEEIDRDEPTPAGSRHTLTGHVLVVDDRRDIRYLVRHVLENAGARVTTVENGQAAIEVIEKAESRGNVFDVVVMDMQMPVLDGYQTTTRLRARGFDRPIIALTAGAMLGEKQKCLQVGCDDFVTKPIEDHRLVALVARCEQRRAEPVPHQEQTVRSNRPHLQAEFRQRGVSCRILIVDDKEDASAALSKLLSMLDHEVKTVCGGQSAIAEASSYKPDVIILDIGLPDMDGYEVASRLRASGEFDQTVLLALSGSEADPERFEASGIDHYLMKPSSISELLPLFPQASLSTVPDSINPINRRAV